jgi:hypothetical protein
MDFCSRIVTGRFGIPFLFLLQLQLMGPDASGVVMAFLHKMPKDKRHKSPLVVRNQPSYQIDNIDLSNLWLDLVRQDKVAATVQLPSNSDDEDATTSVKYGVRMVSGDNGIGLTCQEYVVEEGLAPGEISHHPTIQSINETLARLQTVESASDASAENSSPSSGLAFRQAGGFIAQLQLVRTLRPPPSPGFSGAVTSIAPPYDATTDSLVTGPLRLELRPLVGRLSLDTKENNERHIQSSPLHNSWDIFHNVSPADARGHFLLLPTISEQLNWRGQIFTSQDCHDIIHIAETIHPPGSLLIGYNSVGAGASQNHIHCHAWPCPPVPLLNDDNPEGWSAYPVSKVTSIYDFCDVLDEIGGQIVEVSYLKYPVFCVLLSAPSESLDLLGKALAVVMECIGSAPHNIGFLNRIAGEEEDPPATNESCCWVDVYVFARSKERSDIVPTLKLGISEMMGVFHAQSNVELELLAALKPREKDDGGEEDHIHDHEEDPGADKISVMEQALADISIENEEDLWQSIKGKLEEFST